MLVAAGSLSLATPAHGTPRHAPRDAATRPDRSFGPVARRDAMHALQRRAPSTAGDLRLGAREALRVTDVLRDADGAEHVRYARTWAGLPVIGGDLLVTTSPHGPTEVTKAQRSPIALATTRAVVPASAAAQRAARGAGRPVAAAPVKVVYAALHAPVLAWQTTVTGRKADGTPIRDRVYTDARTGAQLARFPLVREASGSGRSLYSGTVRLTTTRSGSSYQLRDTTRGGQRTYDKRGSKSGTRGTLFTDANNKWGNGATSSRQSAAVDAAYGAARTWDFYKARFGRVGIRGNGRAAYSRVHYGRAYDNAFWDDSCFCMTYGDGNSVLKPLVSLDVAAHEMTHGVTAATAGLVYTGDAGGLDESTSDVMGTMVEFSAANPKDPGDYYIGEKIVRGGGYIRRMDRPQADGHSVGCWSAATSRLDPHYSSGVGNHAFYLLAEGTGSKTIGGRAHRSTTCAGTPMGGIGRRAAARIWYRALTTKWVSTTSYPQAADGMVAAAKELYGAASAQCAATVAAWKGVAVPLTRGCRSPTPPANHAVADPGFESGHPGAWTVSTDVTGGGDIITDSAGGQPHSGSWYAWLNGYGATANESVSQTVSVPAASTDLLSFQLFIGTQDTSATRHDTLTVRATAGGATRTLASWSNLNGDGAYAARTIDLSSYAGKSVLLRLAGHENNDGLATFFWLDDVGITTG